MFNISLIIGLIIGICNSTNYFNTQDQLMRLSIENRIMHEVESRQAGRFTSLQQREEFSNILRRSNRLSEQELANELERIL